ncbi:hypothetical protein [Spirillospora sp. CA-294931]|uniref:hypothetical protein n=1 Tax=Spirillospora sp. CA-294931 TaxID=3240042 RepID=UPI003D8B29A8
MNSHISRRRRLLMLLAGLFGFVVTTAFSVFPGTSGLAEVVRAGTAAAANIAGSRAPAARADARGPTRTAVQVTVRAFVPDRTTARAGGLGAVRNAGTGVWLPRQAAPAPSEHVATPHAYLAFEVLLPPAVAQGVAEPGVLLPRVAASSVQVRGPPSYTGI